MSSNPDKETQVDELDTFDLETYLSNPLLDFSQPLRKLVFLARSFGRHALELGNEIPTRPLYFLKSPSALLTRGQPVCLPKECDIVHYEAEVAVVLGQKLTKGSSEEEAEKSILGWTILNDVTARSAQKEDGGKFTRAKGYDSFCPIAGQYLPSLDWKNARIQGWLNGECVQNAPLTDMIFTPAQALVAIAEVMSLYPGDLISFGTPAGVGELKEGDLFEVRLCQKVNEVEFSSVSDLKEKVLLSFTHTVIAE